MTETWKQAIGLVAFALNVWGNWELTKQTNRGHIIRLCSNGCWLFYSLFVGAWALLLNHSTFAVINVVGFRRWRTIEEARAAKAADDAAAAKKAADEKWLDEQRRHA